MKVDFDLVPFEKKIEKPIFQEKILIVLRAITFLASIFIYETMHLVNLKTFFESLIISNLEVFRKIYPLVKVTIISEKI